MANSHPSFVAAACRLGPAARATILGLSLIACEGTIGVTSDDLPSEPPLAGGGRQVCDAGELPLRRLSRFEYQRTVEALFEGLVLPELRVPFDEEVRGFSNDVQTLVPTGFHVERYAENAALLATAAAPSLVEGCDARPCMLDAVTSFGLHAFRRPLSSDEAALLMSFYDEGPAAGDEETAMALVIELTLQDASFLYRPEFGSGTEAADGTGALAPFEVASRLSYLLWASMPDDALLDAAAAGELRDEATIRGEVERMLEDPRAREGIGHFFSEWLDLVRMHESNKRPEDGFDNEMRASLQESLDRFIWDEVVTGGGSLQTLMTSPTLFVDANLRELLGLPESDEPWSLVTLPSDERSGVLTHPAVLAGHGYADYASPVLRGVFMLDRVLCAPVAAPTGIDIMPPDESAAEELAGPITNRTLYEAATTKEASCTACHARINPLGFAFEHYDTLGRYREFDRDEPVDATGTWGTERFDNATELTPILEQSEQVRACVVDRWLTYASGGGPLAQNDCVRAELLAAFEGADFRLRDLIVALATHPGFAQQTTYGSETQLQGEL